MTIVLSFAAELWEHSGEAPWVFVTLPIEDADEIRARIPERSGFGSVKVNARIANSEWNTSVFPDKETGSFVLPVKRSIRVQENLAPGDVARVTLRIDV